MKLLEPENYRGGYSAPEGYFETLPDRVLDRIHHKKSNRSLSDLFNYSWAAAASVLLLLGVYMLGYQQGKQVLIPDDGAWLTEKKLIIEYLEDENLYDEYLYSIPASRLLSTHSWGENNENLEAQTWEYLEEETIEDELFL